MSQKHLSTTTKQYQQAYQPLPTTSDTPTITRTMHNPALNTNDETEELQQDNRGLPSTYSSQQLVQSSSESESLNDNPVGIGIPTTLNSHNHNSNNEGTRWCSISSLTRLTNSKTLIVVILCFVNLINYMDRYTVAGVLEDVQREFDIGDGGGGFLQTAFVISYMVFAPLFGFLGDRYSRIWIMVIGIFLWTTTTLAGSFAKSFFLFTFFRALVGIGEASYSTIAPTIISDLFVGNSRSRMLAIFYFAIPVGSGLGYIVGAETAHLANDWRWALRVTPFLGAFAVILMCLLKDPVRGESEGHHGHEPTSYRTDLKVLVKNRSFMLSTCGFTCVSFVAGALAWWGPKFILLGIQMQPGSENVAAKDVDFVFGGITMVAGLVGVALGSVLSQHLKKTQPRADPLICGIGLLISAPLMTGAILIVSKNTIATYILVFVAQVSLNVNWSIVADILLYVVAPTRRSTAEAFQILFSHALGDAGSPYIVGLISEAIKDHLRPNGSSNDDLLSLSLVSSEGTNLLNQTIAAPEKLITNMAFEDDPVSIKFTALQYSLFATCFIEVLGGVFFLATAAYIIRDRTRATGVLAESTTTDSSRRESTSG